jgi:hypothetical protein
VVDSMTGAARIVLEVHPRVGIVGTNRSSICRRNGVLEWLTRVPDIVAVRVVERFGVVDAGVLVQRILYFPLGQ